MSFKKKKKDTEYDVKNSKRTRRKNGVSVKET